MSERAQRREAAIAAMEKAAEEAGPSAGQASWLKEMAEKTMIIDGIPLRSDREPGKELIVDDDGVRRAFPDEE